MTYIKNRHVYLDIVRLLSCLLVICVHVSAIEWNDIPVNSLQWFLLNVFNCAGINGVPLFFMISGALVLNEDYQISLKKLFLNKIGKILCAYYVCLFLYNIVPFLKGWVPITAETIREDLLEAVIYEKGIYHLWFVPVLAVLYMLTPILKEAFKTKKICRYYLVLFCIIGALLPTILSFELPGRLRHFLDYCQKKASLFMLTGYIGYFVLGHYLHSYVEGLTKKKKIFVGIITLMALGFTIFTCYIASVKQGSPSSLTNTPLSVNLLLSSSGIFLLIKNCNMTKLSERMKSLLHIFSKFTFGVYLLHPFVINEVTFINDIKNICVRIALVTIITFAVTAVLKKIPLINKLL